MDNLIQNEVDRITGQVGEVEVKKKAFQIEDVRVQRSPGRKALEKFFEFDFDEVKNDIKRGAKRKLLGMLGDMLSDAIDKIFRQKPGTTASYGPNVFTRSSYSNGGYTNYSQASSKPKQATKPTGRWTFSDLVFAERSQATHLKDVMINKIAADGYLSVMELYDALDDPGNLEPTDNNYGWRDLNGAYVAEEGGLYRLYLPPVVSLK